MRRKAQFATAALMIATVQTAEAAGSLQLIIGELKQSSVAVSQAVGVRNTSNNLVERVEIECGFFRGKNLLGAASGTIRNIEKDETGFAEVVSLVTGADRSECRIVKD